MLDYVPLTLSMIALLVALFSYFAMRRLERLSAEPRKASTAAIAKDETLIDDDFFQKVNEALIVSQSRMLAHHYILTEVVYDLSRTQPDHKRYIANMFERVSARMDQGAIEDEARPVTAGMRDVVARFFRTAGQRL